MSFLLEKIIILILMASKSAPHFETEAWGNSEMAYLLLAFMLASFKLLLRVDETQYVLLTVFIRIVLLQGSERTRRKDKEALSNTKTKSVFT